MTLTRWFQVAFLSFLLLALFLVPLHALLLLQETRRRAPTPKQPLVAARTAQPARAPATQWQTQWDSDGAARRIYLPQATGLAGGWPERARQLLATHAPGLQGSEENRLQLVSERRSPSGVHVRFQQIAAGMALDGAEAVVSFAPGGKPLLIASDLALTPPAAPAHHAAALPADVAERQAMHAVGGAFAWRQPPASELRWRRVGAEWRLAWRVRFVAVEPRGDWQVWIDARTATVLDVVDRALHRAEPAAGAMGAEAAARVFLPDPVTATGDTDLRDHDDSAHAVPEAAYTPVTLQGLDAPKAGILQLRGEYVQIVDWEPPHVDPVLSTNASFVFDRAHSGFEDVMVYFHIDAMQRWYQSLGFGDANNRPQPADAHGYWGEDNSRFLPTLGLLSFGEGGVDDAEDAAVIVHEYAHATQFDIVPTWGIGGHTDAMGEGFGDYLANSYAYAHQPQRVQEWNGVFQWDGHNEFWPGRVAIDAGLRYPDDAGGPPHAAGTLWCSALTDALYLIGDRAVMDRLVLDHHYLLTGMATMEDAANAMLLSDLALHDGAHVQLLSAVFARWGMLAATDAQPLFLHHEPPQQAPMSATLPVIEAQVLQRDTAWQVQQVRLHCVDEQGTTSVWPMSRLQGDRWMAPLPGTGGSDVYWRYWFEAVDAKQRNVWLPEAGNGDAYEFVMGEFVDDFEQDGGWQVHAAPLPATSGQWIHAIPVGTAWQPTQDHTPSGSRCWVTGNAPPGTPASEADVDGGGTVLRSPVWDIDDSAVALLRYWRWFATNSPSTGDDLWRVRATSDGGASWTVLEEDTNGHTGWQLRQFDLASLMPGAATVQLEFLVQDGGGGSLVEGALDDVVLRTRRSTSAEPVVPAAHAIAVHPNPFNPMTTLSLAIAAAGPVRVDVYDLRGRRVRRLLDAPLAAGMHRLVWDGRDGEGRSVASGVYLLQLHSPSGHSARKVTLLR